MPSAEATPPVASGNLIVVLARVDADRFGDHNVWAPGAATFSPSDPAMQIVQPLMREGGVHVDAGVRARSFSSETARRLFPEPDAGSTGPGHFAMDRWHRVGLQRFDWLDGVPHVVGVECLVLREPSVGSVGDRLKEGVDAGGSGSRLCVVLIHLQGRQDGASDPCVRDAAAVQRLSGVLYQHVRISANRPKTLSKLLEVTGSGFNFDPLPGDAESSAFCYPIFTALDMQSGSDSDMLAVRELSTVTPSREHGSQDRPAERVARARADLVRLSDSVSASITSRGMVFLGGGGERYEPFPLYVSAIYADAIALTVLARAALVGVNADANMALVSDDSSVEYERRIEQLLAIRTRQFQIDDAISCLLVNETQTMGNIVDTLRSSLHMERLESSITERSSQLLDTVSMRRDLLQARAARDQARAAEVQALAAEAQEERQQWTNIILATLALISLPLTVLYALIELLTGASEAVPWAVGGTAVIAGVGIVVVATMIFLRRSARHRR